ncbi:hypothetical protein GCM10008934_05440 [Virgibacillus salarius]
MRLLIELSESYQKRPIRFLELWEINDWKIKMYGISYKNDLPSHDLISKAKEIAQQSLPVPAITENRYGAGFVGVHDGKDANFIFVDWWSNENELQHHVYISTKEEPNMFKEYTNTSLIACCWDLKLMSFERDSWVGTVLNHPSGQPSVEEYLQKQLNVDI